MRILPLLFLLFASSCAKDDAPNNPTPPPPPPPPPVEWVKYTIKAGQQSSTHNPLELVNLQELKFKVKFDSTAIYTTALPENQLDVNKLYGFADNNSHHQQYSARIGWRYAAGKLTLHGYVYNNGIRTIQNMRDIQIGQEYDCSISVEGDKYRFTANDVTILMNRQASTPKAQGYKLFPFFGGTENAPHDIHIYIKQL